MPTCADDASDPGPIVPGIARTPGQALRRARCVAGHVVVVVGVVRPPGPRPPGPQPAPSGGSRWPSREAELDRARLPWGGARRRPGVVPPLDGGVRMARRRPRRAACRVSSSSVCRWRWAAAATARVCRCRSWVSELVSGSCRSCRRIVDHDSRGGRAVVVGWALAASDAAGDEQEGATPILGMMFCFLWQVRGSNRMQRACDTTLGAPWEPPRCCRGSRRRSRASLAP